MTRTEIKQAVKELEQDRFNLVSSHTNRNSAATKTALEVIDRNLRVWRIWDRDAQLQE